MIVDRKYPATRAQLIDAIAPALAGSETVVVQAGHFVLYQQDARSPAIPCVASELPSPSHQWIREEFGHFPLLSWRLATELMATHARLKTHFLVLVNDWQYVPNVEARDQFYRDFLHLPASYITDTASKFSLLTPRGVDILSSSSPYFSERSLRNQFHRRVKKLVHAGQLPPGGQITEDDVGATSGMVEILGERREIYCSTKGADCSGEVAQLIDDAHSSVSCDTFINFAPRVCERFVEIGAELPAQLFNTGIKTVINISLPATRVFSEEELVSEVAVTVHGFEANASE